jgi:hypothetical protein
MNLMIALAAFAVSLGSLLISFDVWRRSFRPIVTVAVKTHGAGNKAIAYDLVVLNSGTLPARNIQITPAENSLAPAFGRDASAEHKQKWLACFAQVIALLHNNDRVSCSFGTTEADDAGFWKYNATIPVTITYEGLFWWFGRKYETKQSIQIADSNSFTGYWWEAKD